MPSASLLALSVLPSKGLFRTPRSGPVAPGIHLRIGYPVEFPWPARGFRVERRTLRVDEFDQPGAWTTITTLFPPTNGRSRGAALAEARRRHDESFAGALADLGAVDLGGLVELLLAGPGPAELGRLSIDRAELLALAALDADLARVAGVAWIDTGVPPGSAVEYRVTGLWGRAVWPWHERRVTAAGELAKARAGIALATARGARDEGGRVALVGPGVLALDVHLAREARELEVDITSNVEADFGVRALDAAGEEVTVTAHTRAGGVQVVSSEAPFTQVSLTQGTYAATRWLLSAVRHRRRGGPIGEPEATTEAPIDAPPLTPPRPERIRAAGDEMQPQLGRTLRPPAIPTRVDVHAGGPPDDAAAAPLLLVERGRPASRPIVPPVGPPGPEVPGPVLPGPVLPGPVLPGPVLPGPVLPGPALPVRPNIGLQPRLRLDTGRILDNLRIRLPAIGEPERLTGGDAGHLPVWRALAHHSLDGDDGLTRRGTAGFQSREGRGSHRALVVHGRGLVELRVPEFASLGESLLLSIWVRPHAQSAIAALLARDWQHSVWLGRLGDPGRLRLWLNGKRFESRGAAEPNRWTHVAVLYDGASVRFFLDGVLDSAHSAVLGAVAAGSSGDRVAVGGGPNFRGSNPEYAFSGQIAEVLIGRLEVPELDPRPAALLADLPLDGRTRDEVTGEDGALAGGRFTAGHPENAGSHVLSLDGSGRLSLPARVRRDAIDDEVSVQMWVRPRTGTAATLVALDRRGTFTLSLADGLGLVLSRAGRQHYSRRYLALDRWTHVVASSDAERVRFFIDGRLDSEIDAAPGPLTFAAEDPITVGADGDTGAFTGELAGLRIWRQAPTRPWPRALIDSPVVAAFRLDGNLVELRSQAPCSLRGVVEMSADHPTRPGARAARFRGGFVEAAAPEALRHLGAELTLAAWIRPEASSLPPTLIGHDHRRSFWLGLGTTARLRLWLNGRMFESRSPVSTGAWSFVAAVYDGHEVKMYVQAGRPDAVHPAALGPVRSAPDANLLLGAEVGSTEAAPRYPYRGEMADVAVLSRAVAPGTIERTLAAAPPAATFGDRVPEPGKLVYGVRGVDLFGRTGPETFVGPIQLRDTRPPPPPGGVHARFVPVLGTATTVTSKGEGALTVDTDVRLTAPGLAPDALLAALPRHDLVVTRGRREERFEITRARDASGGLSLDVTAPVLPALVPEPGDSVRIDLDCLIEVEWTWSGADRILAPDADRHRLHWEIGDARRPAGSVKDARADGDRVTVDTDAAHARPAELPGGSAIIAGHSYAIESARAAGGGISLSLRYRARPVIVPRPGDGLSLHPTGVIEPRLASDWTGEHRELPLEGRLPAELPLAGELHLALPTAEEREELADAGLDPRGALLLDAPEGLGDAPAALVGYKVRGGRRGWRSFVEVTRLGEGSRWVVRDPGVERALVTEPVAIVAARVVPGARLREIIAVLPSFTRTPTLPVRIAVTAIDGAGNESALSPLASQVVADRRRPPAAPRPRVTIDASDRLGVSLAQVSWDPVAEPGTRYEVHRAVDESVRAVDLANRQRRRGPWSRERVPVDADVFLDDDDFAGWIASRFPERADDWASVMFGGAEADAMWREWADRFYPSLTDEELRAIAGYPGNEAAFTLVTPRPVLDTRMEDPVPGGGANRLLYRLRTRTAGHAPSLLFGEVSTPARPAWPRPPRAPSITAVEPGDRAVTLRWAINPELDVVRYLVYRAGSAQALEDLRWFEVDVADGEVRAFADPRLRAVERSVRLPGAAAGDVEPPDLLAVWRASELEPGTDPLAVPPRARDLIAPSSEVDIDGDDLVVNGLRRVADDTPVVVVVQDAAGERRLVRTAAPPLELIDDGLPGLVDVAYRVVAVNRAGQASEGSRIVRARPLELEPPPAPVATLTRTADGARDRVSVEFSAEDGLEVMVQRRVDREVAWRTRLGWQPATGVSPWTERVSPHEQVEYRVWSRTPNQLVCNPPAPLVAPQRSGVSP